MVFPLTSLLGRPGNWQTPITPWSWTSEGKSDPRTKAIRDDPTITAE